MAGAPIRNFAPPRWPQASQRSPPTRLQHLHPVRPSPQAPGSPGDPRPCPETLTCGAPSGIRPGRRPSRPEPPQCPARPAPPTPPRARPTLPPREALAPSAPGGSPAGATASTLHPAYVPAARGPRLGVLRPLPAPSRDRRASESSFGSAGPPPRAHWLLTPRPPRLLAYEHVRLLV